MKPIVLMDSSDPLEKCQVDLGAGITVGQLLTPLTTRSNWGTRFGIDNGAFSNFNAGRFKGLLAREHKNMKSCLFVAAPDVVADARRTLEAFPFWHDRLRRDGWPVAVVAQDGCEDLPLPWADVEAVFIGGSTAWKCSDAAMAVAKAAILMEKWVHVGRVNTPERMERWIGVAHSIDGTGISRYTHMRSDLFTGSPLLEEPAVETA